jgi:hypothetical protein
MKAHYLFRKSKLPKDLSGDINEIVSDLKKLNTQEEVLKAVYNIVTTRYHGGKIATYTKLFNILSSEAEDLWNRSGFMHCTNQNYLLTLLLIKSGKFKEEDIKPKWTNLYGISPHQYLEIRLDSRFVDVDAWAATYGIEFGDHAHGLHAGVKELK